MILTHAAATDEVDDDNLYTQPPEEPPEDITLVQIGAMRQYVHATKGSPPPSDHGFAHENDVQVNSESAFQKELLSPSPKRFKIIQTPTNSSSFLRRFAICRMFKKINTCHSSICSFFNNAGDQMNIPGARKF
jgi:hypothetical protein